MDYCFFFPVWLVYLEFVALLFGMFSVLFKSELGLIFGF